MAKRMGLSYVRYKYHGDKIRATAALPDSKYRARALSSKSCDIHYFDSWSDDMAYILGYIFADGSIGAQKRSVRFQLNSDDKNAVQFVKEELKVRGGLHHSPGNGSTRESIYVDLNSVIIVQRLIELGVHPRKTFRNDPFPNVPDKYLPHFIRGYFDGDGCVSISKKNSCRVGFIGTPLFVNGIIDCLAQHAKMTRKIPTITNGKEAVWADTRWTNSRDLEKFYEYIYQSNRFGFCLERKRSKLDSWLKSSRIEMKIWDENSLEILVENYKVLGPFRVGKLINRRESSVKCKAISLGLTYIPNRKRNLS